jgi:hypothetical protein
LASVHAHTQRFGATLKFLGCLGSAGKKLRLRSACGKHEHRSGGQRFDGHPWVLPSQPVASKVVLADAAGLIIAAKELMSAPARPYITDPRSGPIEKDRRSGVATDAVSTDQLVVTAAAMATAAMSRAVGMGWRTSQRSIAILTDLRAAGSAMVVALVSGDQPTV